MKDAKATDGKFICKCDCGGNVRGVEQFNRLFTWCDKCSPVTTITINRRTGAISSSTTAAAAAAPPPATPPRSKARRRKP